MHTQVWVTNLALYGIKPLSSKINKANFQWEVSNTDTYVLSTRTISKKSNNVFSCCWTGRMHFPCRHRVTSTPFSEIRCWSHSTPILAARTQLPRGRFLGHGRKAAFVAFRVMLWHFWHVVAFCGMLRLTQKNFQSHVCEPPKMNVLVLPPPRKLSFATHTVCCEAYAGGFQQLPFPKGVRFEGERIMGGFVDQMMASDAPLPSRRPLIL